MRSALVWPVNASATASPNSSGHAWKALVRMRSEAWPFVAFAAAMRVQSKAPADRLIVSRGKRWRRNAARTPPRFLVDSCQSLDKNVAPVWFIGDEPRRAAPMNGRETGTTNERAGDRGLCGEEGHQSAVLLARRGRPAPGGFGELHGAGEQDLMDLKTETRRGGGCHGRLLAYGKKTPTGALGIRSASVLHGQGG